MKLLLQANDGKTIIHEVNLDLRANTEDLLYPGGAPSIIGRQLNGDAIKQINRFIQEEWEDQQ